VPLLHDALLSTFAIGCQNPSSDQNEPPELLSINPAGGQQRWLVWFSHSRAENKVRSIIRITTNAAKWYVRLTEAAVCRLLTNAISGIGFTVAWQFLQEWMNSSSHR
jgi:hypothetical protein